MFLHMVSDAVCKLAVISLTFNQRFLKVCVSLKVSHIFNWSLISSKVLIEQVSRMEAHLPDTSGLHLGSKPYERLRRTGS